MISIHLHTIYFEICVSYISILFPSAGAEVPQLLLTHQLGWPYEQENHPSFYSLSGKFNSLPTLIKMSINRIINNIFDREWNGFFLTHRVVPLIYGILTPSSPTYRCLPHFATATACTWPAVCVKRQELSRVFPTVPRPILPSSKGFRHASLNSQISVPVSLEPTGTD